MKSTVITIRLPTEKIDKIRKAAEKKYMPFSTYLRMLILDALEKSKKPAGG